MHQKLQRGSHYQLSITCHFLCISTKPHSLARWTSKSAINVFYVIGSYACTYIMVLFDLADR